MGRPGLSQNKKFRRLALEVKSSAAARGHLELMWDSAYEAGDEVLGDSLDVELAAGWHGEPGVLTSLLVRTGFLDEQGGVYSIHDFWHHAPAYVRKRRTRENERRSKVDPCTHVDQSVTSHCLDVDDKTAPLPHPHPHPKEKRIPPTKVGLSEDESIWHQRLRDSWPKNQYDGNAAPYAPPKETQRLYMKHRKEGKTGEEIAWCGHIYAQRMATTRRYLVSLATFLGPQGFLDAEIEEARSMIASQQVEA